MCRGMLVWAAAAGPLYRPRSEPFVDECPGPRCVEARQDRRLRRLPRRRGLALDAQRARVCFVRQSLVPGEHRSVPRGSRQGRKSILRRLPRPTAFDVGGHRRGSEARQRARIRGDHLPGLPQHRIDATRRKRELHAHRCAVLLPDPANPEEIEAHRARLTMEPLRDRCAVWLVPSVLFRPRDRQRESPARHRRLGDWASSAFSGAVQDHLTSVEESSCQGCHMSAEAASDAEMAGANDGKVSSHRWAASHTAMAAQLPDPTGIRSKRATSSNAQRSSTSGRFAQASATTCYPRSRGFGVVSGWSSTFYSKTGVPGIDSPVGYGTCMTCGSKSRSVTPPASCSGYRVPGDDGNDEVFVLRSTVLDAAAEPEILHQVHRFAAPAFDRTLPAHEAQAVRYSMMLPRRLELPLQVDARLLHRKHSLQFQALACEASRTERGYRLCGGRRDPRQGRSRPMRGATGDRDQRRDGVDGARRGRPRTLGRRRAPGRRTTADAGPSPSSRQARARTRRQAEHRTRAPVGPARRDAPPAGAGPGAARASVLDAGATE